MLFKIGDLVIHPAFGIGHIVEIEEKQFYQAGMHLYYKITRLRQRMWMRVEAQEDDGLRLVTLKSELNYYRDLLKSPPVPLNTNSRQRQIDLHLKQDTFQGVCEVMRDLTAWSRHKPLDQADTTTLQKTTDSLCEEWAVAAGVTTSEAGREIGSLLLSAR